MKPPLYWLKFAVALVQQAKVLCKTLNIVPLFLHVSCFAHPKFSLCACYFGFPTVSYQDVYDDSGQHLAEHALNPNCNLGSGASWRGPAGTEGAKFELDYGEAALVEADGFYLRNSKIDGR